MYLNESAPALIGRLTGADMNPGAPPAYTNIFTVPPDKTGCIVNYLIVRNSSGNLDTAAFSFGWNATADDVKSAATAVQLTDSTKYRIIIADAGAVRGLPGGVFQLGVTIAQGAAMTIDIDVFGYYY